MATQQEWFTDLGSKSWTGVDGWMKFDYNPTLYPKFSTVTYASVRWRGTCGFNIGRHGVTLHIKDVNGNELYKSKRLISDKDGVVQVIDGLEQYFQADGMMRHLDFHSNGSYMWTEVGGVHVTIRGVPTTVNFNLSASAGGTVEGAGEVIVPPNHQSMTHTIRALPNGEYEFEYWALDGGQNTNPSIDYEISDTSPFVTQNINTINGQAYFEEVWIPRLYAGDTVPQYIYYGDIASFKEVYMGTRCVWKKAPEDGDTHIKGPYTYTYSQADAGWNVKVTDPDSTAPITRAPSTSLLGKNVTSMKGMFMYCRATSIDLSNFDTSNITNMEEMFKYCQTKSLDLSSFDTSKVTNMGNMFDMSHATSIVLSNFDTSKVTNMFAMFYMTQVTSLDLSSFNTSNVISMSSMFCGCPAASLDLSSFDTSNVTSMNGMFKYCEANALNLSNFNTSKVTNMGWMFEGCKATSINLSSFNTSKVTNMSRMFLNCKATSLDLSLFNTSNVTNMSYMFCERPATSLDLSSFDTSKVTDMEGIFKSCQATSINLSSFNTSKVTNMKDMFYSCQATSLDLSSFDTSNVHNMSYMFYSCQATTGYAKDQATCDKFNNASVTEIPSTLHFTVKP